MLNVLRLLILSGSLLTTAHATLLNCSPEFRYAPDLVRVWTRSYTAGAVPVNTFLGVKGAVFSVGVPRIYSGSPVFKIPSSVTQAFITGVEFIIESSISPGGVSSKVICSALRCDVEISSFNSTLFGYDVASMTSDYVAIYSKPGVANALTYSVRVMPSMPAAQIQIEIPESELSPYLGRSYVIELPYTLNLFNPNPETSGLPAGSTVLTGSPRYSCTVSPEQLTVNSVSLVDFGVINIATPTVMKELNVKITSGTQIPTGTIKFTSTKTNVNDRINLGGAEVSIRDKNTNVEYLMDTTYPITTRDMEFIAELNVVGATPGEVTEGLTVNMAVN